MHVSKIQTQTEIPSVAQSQLYIGLMSGTSLDGVDAALIETDGEVIIGFGATGYRPYQPEERAVLRAALDEARAGFEAKTLTDRHARPSILREAEALITRAHREAVRDLMQNSRHETNSIRAIGFHGQTVLHRPEAQLTIQIGDGAALARATGLPVIYDFRAADVAAGGQGAPLVPVFHAALCQKAGIALPAAILNLGGVANLTLIERSGALHACDTGPANALMDDLMLARTGQPLDQNGTTAAQGQVDETLLKRWLAHPYFAAPAPKSLDRDEFSRLCAPKTFEAHRLEDAMATLLAFSVEGVAIALEMAQEPVQTVIVAGGGAQNTALMASLAKRISAKVISADAIGLSSSHMEAQAFGYLAARHISGMPLTFPGTTGVKTPLCGGVLALP